MRTKTLLTAAVLGAAGLAVTQAQVTSVNAVGYVNKDLVAGLNLLANPLSNGANSLLEVLPVVPSGSTAFTFSNGAFSGSQYADLGGGVGIWAPDATLAVGDGFFLQVPSAATITFVGEVLQGADTNKTVPSGLSIQGSTVPVAGTMTDHGFPASSGDTVFSWDAATQNYSSAQYADLGDGTGIWAPAEPTIGLADAVFYNGAGGAWDRNFTIE